jgi:hypothetical protein
LGEIADLQLAFVAAASLTASDLETSCAAAHATVSCKLLDLGEDFAKEEPSLGLSFLLGFLPMVDVSWASLGGLKLLSLMLEGRRGNKFQDFDRTKNTRVFTRWK